MQVAKWGNRLSRPPSQAIVEALKLKRATEIEITGYRVGRRFEVAQGSHVGTRAGGQLPHKFRGRMPAGFIIRPRRCQ